ncbi:hypothetical protein BD408DRAFT_426641 [Parasitella parasitica]|nr:hypothetical protein BD408DRAFT_426641 [Parasitella parasitica]
MMSHELKDTGHRLAEEASHNRYSNGKFTSNERSSPFNATNPAQGPDGNQPASALTTGLPYSLKDIVLSYPEKTVPVPVKEPVLSLDIEEDEERIMQADWGNESDDEDDNSAMQKQNKRLSTVEREEIEKKDIESKGIWFMHATDDGRPYYYNSITRESAWEIPKTTNLASAVASKAAAAATTDIRTATKDILPAADTQSTATPKTNTDTTRDTIKFHVEMRKKDDASAPTIAHRASIKSSPSASDLQTTNVAFNGRRTNYRSRSRSPCSRIREISNNRGPSRWEPPYSSNRSEYTRRHSRPRPSLPPTLRDQYYYYDDYRYHRRSPSPPPPLPLFHRQYPSYGRYVSYPLYDDRYADVGRHALVPPDVRHRYYDRTPTPLSPPPYHRSMERSWDRDDLHRSRYHR